MCDLLQSGSHRGGNDLFSDWTGAGPSEEHQDPKLSRPSQPTEGNDLCYGGGQHREHRAARLSKCPSQFNTEVGGISLPKSNRLTPIVSGEIFTRTAVQSFLSRNNSSEDG